MDRETLLQNWHNILNKIRTDNMASGPQFEAMMAQLHPQAFVEGFIMFTVDTLFMKSYIEANYLPVIKEAAAKIYNTPFEISIEIFNAQNEVAVSQQQNMANQEASSTPSKPEDLAPTQAATIQGTLQATPQTPLPTTQETNHNHIDFTNQAAEITQAENVSSQNLGGHSRKPWESFGQTLNQTTQAFIPVPAPEVESLQQDVSTHNPSLEPQQTQVIPSLYEKPLSNLSFENFVIGDSNRMAYSMAVAVAEQPGNNPFNPLFIYGKSGLGKTHLLLAIQNYIQRNMPEIRSCYVDASELLNDYTEASAAHDKEKLSFKNFKTRYESVDILLIDDVQQLQGKKQTLDIVFQIFNKLTMAGKQVVLAADRAPKNIDIDERYQTRFNAGGVMDIQPPDIETKLGVIKAFISECKRAESCSHLEIPHDVQLYIADISSSNIRELKSAVTKVIAYMTLNKLDTIDIPSVTSLLENHFSGGSLKRLTIADIQKEVEQFYRISHSDLVGKKRTKEISWARKVAMYLCKQLLDVTNSEIGKQFSKDHSSVIYAISEAEKKLKSSHEFKEEVDTLRQIIRES